MQVLKCQSAVWETNQHFRLSGARRKGLIGSDGHDGSLQYPSDKETWIWMTHENLTYANDMTLWFAHDMTIWLAFHKQSMSWHLCTYTHFAHVDCIGYLQHDTNDIPRYNWHDMPHVVWSKFHIIFWFGTWMARRILCQSDVQLTTRMERHMTYIIIQFVSINFAYIYFWEGNIPGSKMRTPH